eukprot:CAMPEP_0201560200 /NCGR_PEP_ID=MMETSP0173_2-20130828/78147_1 /ASSEMBLY_ACC=CAM_ASM_000268 /TAXON_ID=218659 /ORGANISM="Vexillifera sp., Strain DIVA3 564/2" /LENGTH=281 /DNA_ID=CAMNT_0047974643 /DNA_START=37 /DNA_END=882 /DNA_ORIENTATION=+
MASHSGSDHLKYSQCRYYENEYPDVDELVMVRVNRVTEIGAYVSLLEYNKKEGIILLSNLSRKRIRSVNKHVRVGRQEVLQVLRVDKDKGYIDLSKKLLQAEDVLECQERFKRSKQVHSIMSRVAFLCDMELEQLYIQIGWPLYKKYKHAYNAFKQIVTDDSILDAYELDDKVRKEFVKIIRQRMATQPVKVQTDIEVTCFGFEGIEAIKPALKAGIAVGNDDEEVHIQLITTPLYLMSVITYERERGVEILKKAVSAITDAINEKGGGCTVKVEPRVVAT